MGEWGYIFTNSELGTRCRLVVSITARSLYPWGKAPQTYWIGGWVGPSSGLDAVVKRKEPLH